MRISVDFKTLYIKIEKSHATRISKAARCYGIDPTTFARIAIMEKVQALEPHMEKDDSWGRPKWKYVPPGARPAAAPEPIPREEIVLRRSLRTPPPPAPEPQPEPVSAPLQIDLLVGFVEAARDPRDADKRLAQVIEMINEGSETAEEAEKLIRMLEKRSKK